MNFLKAEWRKLVMANYIVNQEILQELIPAQTSLDLWNDQCYISLVGFMFKNTRVLGIKIPFHIDFEEVNLRFYVRHQTREGEIKRGVVFIKEIVPKSAITLVANSLYNEKYATMPMDHNWQIKEDTQLIEYKWKKDKWNSISVKADRIPKEIVGSSEEEFIAEHYWGYTKINEHQTSEYEVAHPKWQIYKTLDYNINVDFRTLYGPGFAFLNNQNPSSIFLAEGSEIAVKGGKTLKISR